MKYVLRKQPEDRTETVPSESSRGLTYHIISSLMSPLPYRFLKSLLQGALENCSSLQLCMNVCMRVYMCVCVCVQKGWEFKVLWAGTSCPDVTLLEELFPRGSRCPSPNTPGLEPGCDFNSGDASEDASGGLVYTRCPARPHISTFP